MRSFILGGFAVSLLAATPALAQSDPQSWTGAYAGVRLGYSWQPKDGGEQVRFDTNRDGTFGDTVRTTTGANAFSPGFCGGLANGALPAGNCGGDTSAADYAAFVGFDLEVRNNIVVGVVGEYGNSNVVDSVSAFSTTPANYTFSRGLRGTGALRGRVGYALDNTLIYGTGGGAYGRVRNRFGTTNGANAFLDNKGNDARTTQLKDSVWGYTYGGGVEQRIGKFTIGVLYLYTSLKDNDYRVDVQRGSAPVTNPFLLTNATGTVMKRGFSEFNRHAVSITTSYRF